MEGNGELCGLCCCGFRMQVKCRVQLQMGRQGRRLHNARVAVHATVWLLTCAPRLPATKLTLLA